VTKLVRGQDFIDFVQGYKHTAFRLERQERYNEPEEEEPFSRFMAGEPVYGWNEEWEPQMRRRTADGQRMTRVRIVTEPHDDYTRFLLNLARINVAAGEDIHYLARDRAKDLDLPEHDFWLIDSTRVGIMRFTDDATFIEAAVLDDPAVVVRHCYYRDVACHYAIRFAEYAGS
jgi:Family of unknown function (DUF6879)